MKEENSTSRACERCKTFGEKCNHKVKKQRGKFYILARCIAMLVCGRERDHDRDRVSI
ncbi:small polypeptide DEVIL 20 [Raphanus sativus]|uniref:Small polypeptide DEVIL 20 n=1 Tax=Raphanus sativus TaxID=3726 RepID=A0A6J0P047_RAPSA|nr:small polypeptide DEVIL 20 [Raphanus sativus]